MKTIIFGSCRVKRFRAYITNKEQKNDLKICQHHLHNPFEVEQLLNWIVNPNEGSIDFEEKSILHNEIYTRKMVLQNDYYSNIKKSFEQSERVIIEISSAKRTLVEINNTKYDCNLTSIAHLKKINPNLIENISESSTGFEEFKNSIYKIKCLIGDKKLIIVPHYSWISNGIPLKSRAMLRDYVKESCRLLNLTFLDPDESFKKINKSLACIDSSHYTPRFERIISKYYLKKLC